MPTLNSNPQTLRRLGIIIALAAIYFIAGKLGLRLAFINSSATAVWPPTGIALAAVLLFGAGVWPGIFLGALLVNLTNLGAAGGAGFVSLGIAFGNTLEIIIAGHLIKKYAGGRDAFERADDLFRFAMIGFLGASVAAAIGTISLWLGGLLALGSGGAVWFTWLLGDAAGMLIFTPFIILWAKKGNFHWRKEDGTAAAGLLFYILLASVALFEHALPVPLSLYPFASLIAIIVPPLIWAAFRFGRRITATATVFLSTMAVAITLNEPALEAGNAGANDALLFLQLFVSAVSIFTLMFAITVYRQRKGERALASNEKHFRSLVENSSDGILLMDAAGVIQYVSPAVRHIAGYVPEDLAGKPGREFIISEDRGKYDSFSENLMRHPRVAATLEIRAVQKGGTARWVEFAAVNLLDDPAVEAIVVNFRDITERKEIAAAKNNFISSVSYRLCPPLAQAETYIAALLERKKTFTPLERKYLEQLDDANQKMITLTSDIIRLARIELGTIRTSPRVIDLRKTIDEAVRSTAAVAQAKGIRFAAAYPPGRTLITADQNLLGLALQRLVMKFTGLVGEKSQKEKKISITLVRDGSSAVVRFSSPSVGDLHKKLQVNSEEGGEGEGEFTFGFFIIQSLVELMEGRMHFEPGADGEEALVIIFPKSPETIGENRTAPAAGQRSSRRGN